MNVIRLLIVASICLIQAVVAQVPVTLEGQPSLLLSSTRGELNGVLSNPQFAPYPLKGFSFTREFRGNTGLFTYSAGSGALDEISPIFDDRFDGAAGQFSGDGLSYNDQLNWRPVIGADKQAWFVFVSNRIGGNLELFLGYAGGAQYLRLTHEEATDHSPVWAPDGNSIAFVSARSGSGDIYLIENVGKIILDLVAGKTPSVRIKQITDTPLGESDLNWNPDPRTQLLAYSQRVAFPGRELQTHQIRIINLRNKRVTEVTADPLNHYNRPVWDPYTGSLLLYFGISATSSDPTSLYVSEFAWDPDKKLVNKYLEHDKTAVFSGLQPNLDRSVWLPGGESLLLQRESDLERGEIYSVNIQKWISKREQAVNRFDDLSNAKSKVVDYAVRDDEILLITEGDGQYDIFIGKIGGEALILNRQPRYRLGTTERAVTSSSPGGGVGTMVVLGSAVTAGVIAFFLLQEGDDPVTPIAIGRPPGMPENP